MAKYIMINGVIYDAEFDENGNYTIGDSVTQSYVPGAGLLHTVDKSYYASNSADITIEEVYNQLVLTCDTEDIDTIIDSPFEEDDLVTDYTNPQHYAREYVSWGEGKDAANAFLAITKGKATDYDAYVMYDWYFQQMRNKKWKFNMDDYLRKDNKMQYRIPALMFTNTMEGACSLLRLGKRKIESNASDNALHNDLDYKQYVVVALMGRGVTSGKPAMQDMAQRFPIAKYTATKAVGRYSPLDTNTINYFVIKGSFVLSPRCQVTNHFGNLQSINDREDIWHACVHLDDSKNEDGAYYTIGFYKNENANDAYDTPVLDNSYMLRPYNEDFKSLQQFQYKASEGDIDRISYIPFLEARMKIGDKYLVDFFNGVQNFPTYKWLKYDECPMQTDPVSGREFRRTYFTIGANPAFQEYIVGNKYDICNTINPSMNLGTEEGMAIPIKYEDNLSGKIEFELIGPAQVFSDNGIRYYYYREGGNFWSSWSVEIERWGSKLSCLTEADSLWIEDFSVEAMTNNGGYNKNTSDKDIVYTTNTNTNGSYINKKDDIEFKISTQLTSDEYLKMDIPMTIKMNNPSIVGSGEALREIHNMITNEHGKPEEHYLDHYWREYQKPKILYKVTMDEDKCKDWLSHYKFNSFKDKKFFVQSESYNVKYCKKELTLKEI